jgi:hypothetical protein
MSLFKVNREMMLRDEQIALDYLLSRPAVDANWIGAQGMSTGSTRVWWLGATYFVPGILKHFDTEGIMALLAPRPFIAHSRDGDAGARTLVTYTATTRIVAWWPGATISQVVSRTPPWPMIRG